MEELSKEDIIKLIENKNLYIKMVYRVIQSGFSSPYIMTVDSEKELNDNIKLYNLTVLDKNYELLTTDEINHINKEGYLI